MNQELFRAIPAVDRLLAEPEISRLLDRYPRDLVVDAVRASLDNLRKLFRQRPDDFTADMLVPWLVDAVGNSLSETFAARLKPVLNATGTLLHTNLGRAPLPEAALERIVAVSRGYSNLEYRCDEGVRGSRQDHLVPLLCRITGAEDAMVVNNNAAAVLLVLSGLASGREVVVSRGELVEIGGSFRVPDVISTGGARLREVGTTNKTHLRDYRSVVSEQTALLLKVHTSNYRVLGFTSAVERGELVALGREYNLPVVEDLGSGLILPLPGGLRSEEPTVREVVESGVDLVTFSGDKLLGGPQAGIIVGRRELIAQIKQHPLARAIRADKLALAALEGVLQLYLDPERAARAIPVCRMLHMPAGEIAGRAASVLQRLRVAAPSGNWGVQASESAIGGGSLPLSTLSTTVLTLAPCGEGAAAMATRLRRLDTPVICRIEDDCLLFDLRTIAPEEEPLLIELLAGAVNGG